MPTLKQAFVNEFTAISAHSKLSKKAIFHLARFAVTTDDETVSALRNLLAQPDPHSTLAISLSAKVRYSSDTYMGYDQNDVAHWIKSANVFFHAVNELIIGFGETERAVDHTNLTSRFAEGGCHYHERGISYSDQQLTSFALIAAAAHHEYFEEFARVDNSDNMPASITEFRHNSVKHSGHDDFWCQSLASHKIMDLAASSPESAQQILRIIMDHHVFSEEAILHLLDGRPRALLDGAI